MNKLICILANKPISEDIKRAILSLYDSAVSFWGKENEHLILSTISNFEIYSIENLGNWLISTNDKKDSINGIDINTKGLCTILPIMDNGKIINTRNIIFLEKPKTEMEAAFLLSHELFFHAVKSIVQPHHSKNMIMTGLEWKKYSYDKNKKVMTTTTLGGFGLEELSTYYGQYKLMKETYGITIDIDPMILSVATSLGMILENTHLGSIIKNAQITKDCKLIDQHFLKIEKKERTVNQKFEPLTWNNYNQLMDNYLNLYYRINNLSEYDETFHDTLIKYKKTYKELMRTNHRILLTSALLQVENETKKKSLYST